MKKRNRARTSSLFLLELIIAILLFSVASAVCVQFFVKAHTLNEASKELTFSVNECSAAAEIVSVSNSSDEVEIALAKAYGDNFCQDASVDNKAKFKLAFDKNFSPCTGEDAAYQLVINMYKEDGQLVAHISSKKAQSGDEIYSLDVKHTIAVGVPYE